MEVMFELEALAFQIGWKKGIGFGCMVFQLRYELFHMFDAIIERLVIQPPLHVDCWSAQLEIGRVFKS